MINNLALMRSIFKQYYDLEKHLDKVDFEVCDEEELLEILEGIKDLQKKAKDLWYDHYFD